MTDDRPGATLTVAAAATFLSLVVFTTPLVTLPSTAAALAAGPEGQAWILSSMSIGLAVALLPVGAWGDDKGRRLVLVVGAGVLAVTTMLAVLSPNAVVLVAARVGQGIGAGALIACSLGVLGHTFPAGTPGAGRASGIWGASLAAGIAVGPFLATGLDGLVGWTGAYWVEGLAAVALAVAARTLLDESRAAEQRPVDLPGAILLAAALAALLTGLTEARTGFGVVTIGSLAGGVVLLGAFGLVERRRAAPMLDPALLRSPTFLAATLGALANGAGIIACTSFVATVVERGLGRPAVIGAVVLLPWSGLSVVTSLLVRRLPASVSGRLQLAVGLAVVAVGQLLLVGLHPGVSPWSLLPGMAVAGLASGVINAALGREAVASVPAGRGGMGSGANNTARYVGSAIGVTLVAVIATRPSLGTGPAALLAGWNDAVLIATALSVVGAVAVALCKQRPFSWGPFSWGPFSWGARRDTDPLATAGSRHGQGEAGRDPGTPQGQVP